MKPIDTTDRNQSETLAFEIELPQAPATVWRALTDPTLLTQWLLPVLDMPLRVGAEFVLSAPPKPGWDGLVHCRVLEIEPERRLRYSWDVGDDLRTVVTFTLTPLPTGTRLLIVQSGFTPEQSQNFGGARYGWRMMGTRLIELLEALA